MQQQHQHQETSSSHSTAHYNNSNNNNNNNDRALLDLEGVAIRSSPHIVFEEILHLIADASEIDDSHLSSLQTLVPKALPGALDILDKAATSITLVRTIQMKRTAHLVASGGGAPYIVMNGFCSCRAFVYQVVSGSEMHCKHTLAVELKKALGGGEGHGGIRVVDIEEDQFASLLAG
eukprot:PhM_4_TR18610/c2_g1_i1/m.83784